MTKSKWYAQGHQDCLDGFFDPPWQPGHRDYTRYVEGWNDAEAEIQRERDWIDQNSSNRSKRA